MDLMERSLYGGVLILVILTVRGLLRNKLPRRTFPILWGVAMVRLLLPVSFSSVFSVYSLLQKETEVLGQVPFASGKPQDVVPTGAVPVWTGIREFTSGNGISVIGRQRVPMLWVVWCVGAVLCALFFVSVYVRCMRRFRKAIPVDSDWMRQWLSGRRRGGVISVRKARGITAPLTYGVFRPVILLPERLVWEEKRTLEYVLQHEYIHICHYDAAMKLMMLTTLCMYWFHPLVWLMAVLLNRDIELACDEGVLRRFGEQARAGYAMALIGMEEKKGVLMPLYNGFSKSAIEERIKSIMKYKKMTYSAIGAATVLVVCIILVFATSARNAEAAGADTALSGNGPAISEDVPMDPPKEYMQQRSTVSTDPEVPDTVNTGEADGDNKTENGIKENDKEMDTTHTGTAEYTLNYTAEGMEVKEPAYLYTGDGFYLLIPAEGWVLYAPDAWMWEANERVQFWVNDCGESTWEQVEARYTEDGYSRTELDGILWKENADRIFRVNIRRSAERIMCFNYTYPAESEYIEGFEVLLSVIAANFEILPEEGTEALPENTGTLPENTRVWPKDTTGRTEDGKLAEQTALAFWDAYLAGDRDALKQYLTADYAEEPEVFPDGQDGHVAKEAEMLAVKGTDMEEKAVGDSVDIWVEFRPSAAADSLEYLWISMVKDTEGWKVEAYGLEM